MLYNLNAHIYIHCKTIIYIYILRIMMHFKTSNFNYVHFFHRRRFVQTIYWMSRSTRIAHILFSVNYWVFHFFLLHSNLNYNRCVVVIQTENYDFSNLVSHLILKLYATFLIGWILIDMRIFLYRRRYRPCTGCPV